MDRERERERGIDRERETNETHTVSKIAERGSVDSVTKG